MSIGALPSVSGRARRLRCRLLTVAATFALALLASAPAAMAHTVFDGSNPADGSVVAAAPDHVELNFSQDVGLSFTQIQLVDAAGHGFPGLVASIDPTRPNGLIVALPPLPRQTYRLSFQTRDPVDLHRTSSSVVFGVGTAPTLAAARPSLPGPDWSESGLRWMARTGLAAALGALVIALLVVPKALEKPEVPHAGRSSVAALQASLLGLAMAGVFAAGLGDTGLLALQANRIGPLGSSFGRVLSESEFGRRWIVGLQLGAGAVLVLAWLRARARAGISTTRLSRRGWRGRWHPAVVAGVVLVTAQAVAVAASGHITEVTRPKQLGVALLSAHLLAVGAWIGALLALIGVWQGLRRSQPGERAAADRTARALLEAFSPVAATGLVVVVATGLLLSGSQVATVTALLSSPYGTVLIAKSAAVAVAAAFGAYHFCRMRRRAGVGRRATTTLMVEAALGAVVILGGAALATAAPALGPQYRRPTVVTGSSVLTTTAADLVVRVSLRPDRPGPNLLAVDVLDTRRPAPAPVETVTVALSGPATDRREVTLTPAGSGHYDGGAVNLKPGPLEASFSIVRPGEPVAAGRLPWVVNGPQPYRQPVVVSTARLAPITTGAAGVVVGLALVCFGVSRWRGRSRRRSSAGAEPAAPLTSPVAVGPPADALVGAGHRGPIVPA